MTVIRAPQDFNEDDLYIDLRATLGHPLFLKCEGFNFAGSVKLKAAVEMVEAAERTGALRPGSILVESSSGNLGVALSVIAASKGYRFLCVTDSRCNLSTRRLMEALGSQVQIIVEPTPDGGLLGARLDYVRALCAADDRYVWLNQYTNPQAWKAHHRTTAPAIARQFPQLDVLFVGAGYRRPRARLVDDVEHCLKVDTSPHLVEQLTGNRHFLAGTLDDVMAGRITIPHNRPVIFSPFGLGVLDLAVGKFVYDEIARDGTLQVVDDFFHELRRHG